MFDISEKLIDGQSDEIYGVTQYSLVVVQRLNGTKEPKGWRRLHVGCEHLQRQVTNSLQRHWESE